MHLLRSNRNVPTFFDLLGQKEDDMTFGLGLVASRSERFLSLLVERIAGSAIPVTADAVIRLQTVEGSSRGRTDVEIELPGQFAAVLEAKRGVELPDVAQLEKYVPVLQRIGVATMRLVTVSNTPHNLARMALPAEVGRMPVVHLTWRGIRQLARNARLDDTNRNKHLLDEFHAYLTEILGMEKIHDNMVYVVSLGQGSEWGLESRAVVNAHKRYFYPVGDGWPEPPNYIAFRYDGQLQTIHHVDAYEVFTNPGKIFAGADDITVKPHYCLKLGAPIRSAKAVKNGPSIQRSNRCWVMIDTLLTCETITDALVETKKRIAANED